MLGVALFRPHFVTQRNDRGMHAQLQDGVHLPARVLFDIDQAINVPGVQYQRLFTNGIGACTQGKAHVAVVQVVGRANRNVIHSVTVIGAAQLIDMPVEALKFREKVRFREIAIDNANGIVLVHGGNQVVTSVFDRFHMARCDVTGSADQCELFAHRITLTISSNLFVTLRGNQFCFCSRSALRTSDANSAKNTATKAKMKPTTAAKTTINFRLGATRSILSRPTTINSPDESDANCPSSSTCFFITSATAYPASGVFFNASSVRTTESRRVSILLRASTICFSCRLLR